MSDAPRDRFQGVAVALQEEITALDSLFTEFIIDYVEIVFPRLYHWKTAETSWREEAATRLEMSVVWLVRLLA